MSRHVLFSLFLLCISQQSLQTDLNFVIFYQNSQNDVPFMCEEIFERFNSGGSEISRNYRAYNASESLDEFESHFCSQLMDPSKFNVILDLVWTSFPRIHQMANDLEIPYFKIDTTIYPLMEPAVKFLEARLASESVFIMGTKEHFEQAPFGLTAHSDIRMLLLNGLDQEGIHKLLNIRPMPEFTTIVAGSEQMNQIFQQAVVNGLVRFPDRWNLMFLDPYADRFKFQESHPDVTRIVVDHSFFCQWMEETRGQKECNTFGHLHVFLRETIETMIKFYKSNSYAPQITAHCEEPFNSHPSKSPITLTAAERDFFGHLLQHPVLLVDPNNQIKFRLEASIYKGRVTLPGNSPMGNFSSFSGQISSAEPLTKPRRYFRIGTAYALPYSTYKLDARTGEILRTAQGEPVWEGYCIDFVERLSQIMDFDYDIVEPQDKLMGERVAGKFNGAMGDLIRGETDIIAAALVTTAEREEEVDFVPPNFDESGISIVIREPVRATSLFKFMSVLKTEVWLTILASLVVSALLIWFLEKFSPYSAQNMEYPFESRLFSLKESFWFVLTSYTPQGGGELPKSLSARILVATFWLFVVLILATFTANLAAFLTVERMNTPVTSLEQLGKQSRINYTVVEGSEAHNFFINMHFAEELLYETWKKKSLESVEDQGKYRTWDYVVAEQYGKMLRAINQTGTVPTAADGMANVMNHLNGDYAFIHDSQELKYEMMRNCELLEIGEVFAKRPYGLAVQQGNALLVDEITKAILKLQGERFFDHLNDKYWNASIGNCDLDENEGMTLQSLGGVFLVTIFGLGIAAVALVVEWLYYWKKARNNTELVQVKPRDEERNSGDVKRGVLRKRKNAVGVGDEELEPGHAFGVHKRSVSIVEDHNESFE